MTAAIEQELAAVCDLYRVTREELVYERKPGRPREGRYVQMARGVFIVRCCVGLGAAPRDIAAALGISRREVGHWRTELLARGLVKRMTGHVRGVATVVVRKTRAA